MPLAEKVKVIGFVELVKSAPAPRVALPPPASLTSTDRLPSRIPVPAIPLAVISNVTATLTLFGFGSGPSLTELVDWSNENMAVSLSLIVPVPESAPVTLRPPSDCAGRLIVAVNVSVPSTMVSLTVETVTVWLLVFALSVICWEPLAKSLTPSVEKSMNVTSMVTPVSITLSVDTVNIRSPPSVTDASPIVIVASSLLLIVAVALEVEIVTATKLGLEIAAMMVSFSSTIASSVTATVSVPVLAPSATLIVALPAIAV